MEKGADLPLKKRFSSTLLKWNREKNERQMPWKGERDPYKIWLSEIILQQTRVEQGLNYYNRIIITFPDIHQLANAKDEKVFKLWEGLGYYSRCRNLLSTARFIAHERKGEFPATYDEIHSLKGVGAYTAAAIASFAYDLPYAVIDGNVFRVLSRIFGIDFAIDSVIGKKFFKELAQELLDKKNPATYNQAIMDFGAVVCRPVNPQCSVCVFRKNCNAYLTGRINELPVKEKKIQVKTRYFYYLVAEYRQRLVIRQRKEKDIWRDLYEFPLIESNKRSSPKKVLEQAVAKGWLPRDNYKILSLSDPFRQQLSHQLIAGQFIHVQLFNKFEGKDNWRQVPKNDIGRYPFSKNITNYLAENSFHPQP